ncbi:collagen alpha-1(II) chain-like [Choloepus didactylus]|uniref:collagen alpha-1(II) chain-like n=1 Tax=Choloepus didactylus TaxID=27675 RepID=UPI00189E2A15|nr:collagen alpha-1(II) chain-like [Choloepus didactylus]
MGSSEHSRAQLCLTSIASPSPAACKRSAGFEDACRSSGFTGAEQGGAAPELQCARRHPAPAPQPLPLELRGSNKGAQTLGTYRPYKSTGEEIIIIFHQVLSGLVAEPLLQGQAWLSGHLSLCRGLSGLSGGPTSPARPQSSATDSKARRLTEKTTSPSSRPHNVEAQSHFVQPFRDLPTAPHSCGEDAKRRFRPGISVVSSPSPCSSRITAHLTAGYARVQGLAPRPLPATPEGSAHSCWPLHAALLPGHTPVCRIRHAADKALGGPREPSTSPQQGKGGRPGQRQRLESGEHRPRARACRWGCTRGARDGRAAEPKPPPSLPAPPVVPAERPGIPQPRGCDRPPTLGQGRWQRSPSAGRSQARGGRQGLSWTAATPGDLRRPEARGWARVPLGPGTLGVDQSHHLAGFLWGRGSCRKRQLAPECPRGFCPKSPRTAARSCPDTPTHRGHLGLSAPRPRPLCPRTAGRRGVKRCSQARAASSVPTQGGLRERRGQQGAPRPQVEAGREGGARLGATGRPSAPGAAPEIPTAAPHRRRPQPAGAPLPSGGAFTPRTCPVLSARGSPMRARGVPGAKPRLSAGKLATRHGEQRLHLEHPNDPRPRAGPGNESRRLPGRQGRKFGPGVRRAALVPGEGRGSGEAASAPTPTSLKPLGRLGRERPHAARWRAPRAARPPPPSPAPTVALPTLLLFRRPWAPLTPRPECFEPSTPPEDQGRAPGTWVPGGKRTAPPRGRQPCSPPAPPPPPRAPPGRDLRAPRPPPAGEFPARGIVPPPPPLRGTPRRLPGARPRGLSIHKRPEGTWGAPRPCGDP